MESDYTTAEDAVVSLRNILPWIILNPTFESVNNVDDLLSSAGPVEAFKFLEHLDPSVESPSNSASNWPAVFNHLCLKLLSSCGCEPPAAWFSSPTTDSIRWLKFFQLALVHGVHFEDRVAQIEAIRSQLPDHVQRELMNQISQVQQDFLRSDGQDSDNRSSNPSPISFASLLGDSEQDLSILCNNNNVRGKKLSFYRELERLRDQVRELEAEKAELEEKTRELRGKLTDSEERALKLEYTVEEQTEKSEQLRAEVKMQIEAKSELASEARLLRDEMDVLRERASRSDAAEAANAIFKERVARMEAELAKRDEKRLKLVPVTEAEKTMAILTESVAVAREEGDAYRRRASLAEDEVVRLRRKVDRLEAEKADWEREREGLLDELRRVRLAAAARDGEDVGGENEGASGRVLLAEIEDYADDYEELGEVQRKVDALKHVKLRVGLDVDDDEPSSDRTYGEDDGFCDYDLNTSESSAGAGVPGVGTGNDSDYETCGNSTPKNGSCGYDKVARLTPPVVATTEEAPRCVTVHHVKVEVYEPPPVQHDEVDGMKLVVVGGAKFDADPLETTLSASTSTSSTSAAPRVPKRPKRHGTPPKSSSAVRNAVSGPGAFWNRRRGPRPGSETSLSSEPSIYYQDIKFTDDVQPGANDVSEIFKEDDIEKEGASLPVNDAELAEEFYGNSRVSRRSRHEAEMLEKARRDSKGRNKGRSKSRGKVVSGVLLDVIGMCGP